MANKEKMGPPTLEMIQGNPYNYTFDEVAKCMGEERAKSLFKTLYKNGVSPKNQTMTIKDICDYCKVITNKPKKIAPGCPAKSVRRKSPKSDRRVRFSPRPCQSGSGSPGLTPQQGPL